MGWIDGLLLGWDVCVSWLPTFPNTMTKRRSSDEKRGSARIETKTRDLSSLPHQSEEHLTSVGNLGGEADSVLLARENTGVTGF